jgi:hypothetical protein
MLKLFSLFIFLNWVFVGIRIGLGQQAIDKKLFVKVYWYFVVVYFLMAQFVAFKPAFFLPY